MTRSVALRAAPWLLGAAALLAASRTIDPAGWTQAALAAVAGLGPWGPALFILLYAAACVLFIPGSLMTLAAGAAFGVIRGLLYVSIAATLGATAAFLIGRYAARARVEGWLAGDPRFKAVDEAVGRQGWKIVLLMRLSPAFPFTLLNYAFGLTGVRLRHYVLASWAGMLPGTALYVYLGSLAGDLAGLGGERPPRGAAEWAFYGIGLGATVAVTLYTARVARKALKGT